MMQGAGIDCPFCVWVTAVILAAIGAAVGLVGFAAFAAIWWSR